MRTFIVIGTAACLIIGATAANAQIAPSGNVPDAVLDAVLMAAVRCSSLSLLKNDPTLDQQKRDQAASLLAADQACVSDEIVRFQRRMDEYHNLFTETHPVQAER
jgi:hypothetical protein